MWSRAFQTLRSSCEKEWAMKFPQYAVSKWLGHSIEVSGKHYANDVPDELFVKAAQHGEDDAMQNAVQQAAEQGCEEANSPKVRVTQNAKNPVKHRALHGSASSCRNEKKWSRGDSNPRAGAVGRSPLRA